MTEFYLKELIQIFNGKNYSHLKEGEVPLYGTGGIMLYVDDFLYEGEAILLPRKGSLTNIMYIDGKIWTVDTMYYATTNEKANPYYLYSYLSLLNLKHLDSGSTLPSMTKSAYENIKVKIPRIETQQKIAKILSDLDAKIELNNKINAELEAMAKTIYEYWFVQFDFPDENGKPYKSSGGKMLYNEQLKREIPEGWEVKTLKNIASISKSTLNPMDEPEKEFRYYSLPEFDATGTYSNTSGKEIRSNKFTVKSQDILVSKLNPWFSRVIYPTSEQNMICSTEFVVWEPELSVYKNFLYQLATYDHFIAYCTQSATGTSNSHKRVNPDLMMNYKTPYNKDIIIKYSEIIEPWLKKIALNRKEKKELTELRDWLLPMLMNGQISVGEAEEELRMVAEEKVNYGRGNA